MGILQGCILSVTLFCLKINSIVKTLLPDIECSLNVDEFLIFFHSSQNWKSDNPCMTRFVGDAPEYQKRNQSWVCDNRYMMRFVSDARADDVNGPNIEGEVEDEGVIIVAWRNYLANPEARVWAPEYQERSQRPNVHAMHPSIMGEA